MGYASCSDNFSEYLVYYIGIALLVTGLIFGYFTGVHTEHNVMVSNIYYLENIAISIALVVVGGPMVIFGLKKRLKSIKCRNN